MVTDFDYLPLPDLGGGGANAGKAGKNGKNKKQ
jgi:hypothetical protein